MGLGRGRDLQVFSRPLPSPEPPPPLNFLLHFLPLKRSSRAPGRSGNPRSRQPEGEHSRSRSHGSLGDVSHPATTYRYLARIMDSGMGKCSLVILVLVGIDWLASVPCGATIPGPSNPRHIKRMLSRASHCPQPDLPRNRQEFRGSSSGAVVRTWRTTGILQPIIHWRDNKRNSEAGRGRGVKEELILRFSRIARGMD